MPSSIQNVADVARMAGYQKQVDEFILSMNRAAEAAAPMAARYFGDAIRDMTLEDVRGILTGGNTAATEFFRRKTHDKLYVAFKPIVSQKVGEVGATRAYKNMMGRYSFIDSIYFRDPNGYGLKRCAKRAGHDAAASPVRIGGAFECVRRPRTCVLDLACQERLPDVQSNGGCANRPESPRPPRVPAENVWWQLTRSTIDPPHSEITTQAPDSRLH